MRLIRHRARATGDKQILNPLFNQPAPDERYPAKNGLDDMAATTVSASAVKTLGRAGLVCATIILAIAG
jgi:hypothetical protein